MKHTKGLLFGVDGKNGYIVDDPGTPLESTIATIQAWEPCVELVRRAKLYPDMLDTLVAAAEHLHRVANGSGPVKKLMVGQLKTECREIRDTLRAAVEAARSN